MSGSARGPVRSYLTSWFLVDFISIIPVDRIFNGLASVRRRTCMVGVVPLIPMTATYLNEWYHYRD